MFNNPIRSGVQGPLQCRSMEEVADKICEKRRVDESAQGTFGVDLCFDAKIDLLVSVEMGLKGYPMCRSSICHPMCAKSINM